jgi:hypothetical protein
MIGKTPENNADAGDREQASSKAKERRGVTQRHRDTEKNY